MWFSTIHFYLNFEIINKRIIVSLLTIPPLMEFLSLKLYSFNFIVGSLLILHNGLGIAEGGDF